jgi:hypothetical protein
MEIKDCFVIMPFSTSRSHSKEKWTELFESFFKPAWESCGIRCYRTQVARGSITKEIIEKLYAASVVFADLTDSNPNVMYELGVRHTFKKPSVMVKAKNTKIPFDVNDYNVFEYQNTPRGLEKLKRHIEIVIQDIDTHPNKSDNPVWDFRNTSDFLIDYYRTTEILQKLEAVKVEFESNLKFCKTFLAKIENIKVPEGYKEWRADPYGPSIEEDLIIRSSMQEFYPFMRNDALTHLKISRYVDFAIDDWNKFNKLDDFLRCCNLYSNNLADFHLFESERQTTIDITNVIQACVSIIDKRITELKER